MLPRDELLKPATWAKILAIATFAGLECGLVGPFGSYPANFFTRTAYWVSLFWIGSLCIWPSLSLGLSFGPRHGFPAAFSGAAALLLACAPLAAIAALGCRLFWPLHASGMNALEFYELTLLVAFPSTAAILWVLRLSPKPGAAAQSGLANFWGSHPATADARAKTGSPLPDFLLETALCLQMEDHHVRVHLHGRSELYLLPMQRAVEAMTGRRGLQVHRSWWVAEDAVTGSVANDRSVSLVLSNGMQVPVARNRIANVRASGLLDIARHA